MASAAKRCAIYARVSTADQNPDMQMAELRAMAAQRKWDVIGEYVDHGISGTKVRRPELDRLQADVSRGKVDVVVVWKFDRFARSVRQLVLALEDFRTREVDFVSLRDGIDTSTPSGRFTFHVIAAVAELERELIRERTIAGVAAARKRGARLGRPRRSLDVDGAVILQAQGQSLRQIARQLGVGVATLVRRMPKSKTTT